MKFLTDLILKSSYFIVLTNFPVTFLLLNLHTELKQKIHNLKDLLKILDSINSLLLKILLSPIK